MKLTWVAARLNPDELAKLDAQVEEDCSSRCAVVRKALRAYLDIPPFLAVASRNRVASCAGRRKS